MYNAVKIFFADGSITMQYDGMGVLQGIASCGDIYYGKIIMMDLVFFKLCVISFRSNVIFEIRT